MNYLLVNAIVSAIIVALVIIFINVILIATQARKPKKNKTQVEKDNDYFEIRIGGQE